MKKKSILALRLAALAIVSGYGGMKAYQASTVNDLDMLSQNIEALADDSESSCRNHNGYRQWSSSSTIFSRKKEFYDCCYMLREGYSPSGNCN